MGYGRMLAQQESQCSRLTHLKRLPVEYVRHVPGFKGVQLVGAQLYLCRQPEHSERKRSALYQSEGPVVGHHHDRGHCTAIR